MPGLQLVADQSLFPVPRALLLLLASLSLCVCLRCVLCAVSLSATQYLGGSGRMGRNPSIWRQFRCFFCLSKPVPVTTAR